MSDNIETNDKNIINDFRDVSVVARRILIQIPPEETHFIKDINKFILDCEYYAPEVLKGSDSWIPFTNILNIYINGEKLEWQEKIINIYMGYE